MNKSLATLQIPRTLRKLDPVGHIGNHSYPKEKWNVQTRESKDLVSCLAWHTQSQISASLKQGRRQEVTTNV